MTTMNKGELIKAVEADLENQGFAIETHAQAERIVTATLNAIRSAVESGDDVRLPGFGSFTVVDRAARHGHNIRTGEDIEIPARKAIKFAPGSAFKEAVNK